MKIMVPEERSRHQSRLTSNLDEGLPKVYWSTVHLHHLMGFNTCQENTLLLKQVVDHLWCYVSWEIKGITSYKVAPRSKYCLSKNDWKRSRSMDYAFVVLEDIGPTGVGPLNSVASVTVLNCTMNCCTDLSLTTAVLLLLLTTLKYHLNNTVSQSFQWKTRMLCRLATTHKSYYK